MKDRRVHRDALKTCETGLEQRRAGGSAAHGLVATRRSRGATAVKKVYVAVNSDFDCTGYMQPRSITWSDGRTFKIDAVKDYRPADFYRRGARGACYTIMIHGQERRLFFEKSDSTFANHIARWYVETEEC